MIRGFSSFLSLICFLSTMLAYGLDQSVDFIFSGRVENVCSSDRNCNIQSFTLPSDGVYSVLSERANVIIQCPLNNDQGTTGYHVRFLPSRENVQRVELEVFANRHRDAFALLVWCGPTSGIALDYHVTFNKHTSDPEDASFLSNFEQFDDDTTAALDAARISARESLLDAIAEPQESFSRLAREALDTYFGVYEVRIRRLQQMISESQSRYPSLRTDMERFETQIKTQYNDRVDLLLLDFGEMIDFTIRRFDLVVGRI